MLPGVLSLNATSTKINGSSGMRGWKKAKQRRSSGARRARNASHDVIS